MSELIKKNEIENVRHKLLAGTSALVLMTTAAVISTANAENADRPTLWIELGGQFNESQNSQELFSPTFVSLTPSNFTPPQMVERPPKYGFDENAALVIQPGGSDWIFSASIRYGRLSKSKHVRNQSDPSYTTSQVKFHRGSGTYFFEHTNTYRIKPFAARFTDAVVKQSETHAIVDFQAGRDLGVGMFTQNASSSLNVGVRFAQFTSKSRNNLKEDPDWQFKAFPFTFSTSYYSNGIHYSRGLTAAHIRQPYHSFAGNFRADRSFTGVGPTIAWNSSMPVMGNAEAGELALDWGMNAALLFGRQKAKIHHQTSAHYYPGYYGAPHLLVYNRDFPSRASSRSVIVPNIGGFAGISVRYPNAKVSFGYKADFFFGAMDGGIDVRRTEDVGFHGPFATVSIGLGG